MLNNADPRQFKKIYLALGYTDLRKGIQGLSMIIEQQFHLNPYDPDILFMFCGRRADRIKCLVWERDGWLLLYKRLEAKESRFQWPRTGAEAVQITSEQFTWLMQGLSIEQSRRIRQVQPTLAG